MQRYADPSAFVLNQHDQTGKTLADKLADYGLAYIPATKQRAMSDRRILSALSFVQNNGFMIKSLTTKKA